jgi:hypothetical protein
MLVSPPKHKSKLNPNAAVLRGGAFRRGLGHDIATSMNRISDLIKDWRELVGPLQNFLLFCQVRHSIQSTILEDTSPSPGTELVSTSVLDFPAARTRRYKFLLLINDPVCSILL